LGQLLFL
jgi:hypothetical protein